MQEAREAGANAFISKPLFRSRLARTFSALVGEEEILTDVPLSVLGRLDLTGRRALLVEDNDLNREIAAAILSEMDIQVEEAENGKVAVEMVRSSLPGYYGMVLMDIQMPVMDGYEATRAIRALDRTDTDTLPIIAVSANAFEEDRVKSKEAGMNEHIAKPFNREKLEAVIGKYLTL